jgi:hypothetical protein
MLARFREFSTPKKTLTLWCSMLLVAVVPVAGVAVPMGSASGSPPSTDSAGVATSSGATDAAGQVDGATQLLPGAQRWGKFASSYVFGTNDAIEYASPNVDTLPSVQADLKSGGLTLMRTWAYSDYTDADIEQRIATIQNAGMKCMMMLGSTSKLKWMKHVVSLLGSNCKIYEFGNEPDNSNNHTSIAQVTSEFIADVPKLRALNPSAVFGGPAPQWAESNIGSGSYPSDIAYFLSKTEAAGVRADFISYHDYPCQKATTEAQCIQMTPGDLKYNYRIALKWEKQYYGGTVPTGVSEYNFDPGTNNLYAWGDDGAFMKRWTTTALDAFVADGVSFANEFTSLNYSGYGYLDMFRDTSPYRPKAQFKAMAAAVARYGGSSDMAIANSSP